jgi:hypothetical protein
LIELGECDFACYFTDFYCPSGTGDISIGTIATDGPNRGINNSFANPYADMTHVRFTVHGDVRLVSAHDTHCLNAIDADFQLRYTVTWAAETEDLYNPTLLYLRKARPHLPDATPYTNDTILTGRADGKYYRPITTNDALTNGLYCARDHKWRLVDQVVYRKECDCVNYFKVVAAVYRLWKCTSAGNVTALGFGSLRPPYYGNREYWFEFGHLEEPQCKFSNYSVNKNMNLTAGPIEGTAINPAIGNNRASGNITDLTNAGVELQFTWTVSKNFLTYHELNASVTAEYELEYAQIGNTRTLIDPYIFDLMNAINLINEYGTLLEELVWIDTWIDPADIYATIHYQTSRSDLCSCQKMFYCPNGTTSSTGAVSWSDCTSTDDDVLRRASVVPSRYYSRNDTNNNPAIFMHMQNATDFWELGGADVTVPGGEKSYPVGTVTMQAFDNAIVTIDIRDISYNFSYGEHYRLSVYVDCKPCPTRYRCSTTTTTAPACITPSVAQQTVNYNDCLKRYTMKSCVTKTGHPVDCSNTTAVHEESTFQEPDMFKCLQIPYFCDDICWPKYIWDIARSPDGNALDYLEQEKSTYTVDPVWEAQYGGQKGACYTEKKGCCKCERHNMPYYFVDDSKDLGYPDNKRGILQMSLLAVAYTELTIVMELIHGQFYTDFDEDLFNKGDISFQAPNRALYSPSNSASNPSRHAFLNVISSSMFAGSMALPLNLPLQGIRKQGQAYSGALATMDFSNEEESVLIGRTSSLYQADPDYESRYTEYKRSLYVAELVQLIAEKKDRNLTDFIEFANVPDLSAMSTTLYPVADPMTSVTASAVDNSGQGFNFIGIPYFPYFSNCKGSDSFLDMNKMFETDPRCTLVDYDNTVYVSPYPWTGLLSPNSDQCNSTVATSMQTRKIGNQTVPWLGNYAGAIFDCIFEEEIDVPLTIPRWYEADGGTLLFSIGNDPFPYNDYAGIWDDSVYPREVKQYWGRSAHIGSIIGSYRAIPVSIQSVTTTLTASHSCNGYVGVVPRQVRLTIDYYQITQGQKRIIAARVYYIPGYQCHTYTDGSTSQKTVESLGIPQCIVNFQGAIATSEYQLEVLFVPLAWFDLLNYFAFSPGIYFLFFLLTGIVCVGLGWSVYILNRLLTRLRHPPRFHGGVLFYTNAFPILMGSAVSTLPVMLGVVLVWQWFMAGPLGGTVCSPDVSIYPNAGYCFESVYDWAGALSPSQLLNGRKAVCLMGIGLYCNYVFVVMAVPNWSADDMKTDKEREDIANGVVKVKAHVVEEDEDPVPDSVVWKPHIWRRGTVLLAMCFMLFAAMVQIELSYSSPFSSYCYEFIIAFKLIYFITDNTLLNPFVRDALLAVPLDAATGAVSNMTTMGAPSFTSFVLSYFAGELLTFTDRLYWSPFIKQVIALWPRWMLMFRRRMRGNKRMTREEKAKEELEWRKVNEEIALQFEGIEPLLDSYVDYAIDSMGYFISPQYYVTIYLFYLESEIYPNYKILTSQVIYYIMFAVLSVPYQMMCDVFLFNAQELIFGWKVYDYLSYQRYRFTVREHRWVLRNNIFDESVTEEFQKMDLLCFSSQFYFLMGLMSFGFCLFTIAIEIIIRQNYNILGDPVLLLLLFICFLGGELMSYICVKLADVQIRRLNWRGLWITKHVEGTVDDDVAAKLAIGEGRQADLEQERLELQALNSERFRHRFLERNRPWILQHLVDLLTPRALEQEGPDKRPTIEYVRDVYAELLAMGEGLRKAGDRADISSDDEDEVDAARRNWSRQPLSGAALAIARMWLAKARKRRAFGKLVRGIIEQNVKSSCEICGRTPQENKVRLVCHLASKGEPDHTSLDKLIAGFEGLYGAEELDPNLWKAYFRANAEYCTRCSVCEDSVEMDRMMKAGRLPQEGRPIRPQDVSSDEDDDEVDFEPLVVTRTSPEGRMMSKWLLAARKKLGGNFPRPDARRQMERYAQKLRQLKMKKAREVISGGPKAAQAAAAAVPAKLDVAEQSQFNAATRALAQRWVRMARDNLDSKFRLRSVTLREDLDKILEQMPEEEDWYYSGAVRLEGRDLLKKGQQLEDDRKVLETEAAVKIHKIEQDRDELIATRESELARERRAFEAKVAQQGDRIMLDIEVRRAELEKTKEIKRKEFQAIEKAAQAELGAAPTEMIQNHLNQLIDIDDMITSEKDRLLNFRSSEENEARIMFERAQLIKKAEVERRRALASENIARIREELAARVKLAESQWQAKASKWLVMAKRKVEVKKREDEEARAGKRKRGGK